MILKYSPLHEELIFAIRYLSLSLKYIEHDSDIALITESGSFIGTRAILEELHKLCQCEPHDLKLLNSATIKDIERINKTTPIKSFLNIHFNKQESCESVNEPSHISLKAYVNKKSFSIADIFLFAKTYKALLEGMKMDTREKEWFYEFQEALNAKMSFKKLDEADFEFVKIQVGKIIKIRNHEEADKLFIEEVDFGNERRTIVSGLRSYYKEDELLGRYCLFVTNLKNSKLKGVESQGMILCVRNGESVMVIDSPCLEEGMCVEFDKVGIDVVRHYNTKIIDGKNEIFKEIMAKLKIDNHILTFKGKSLCIRKKEVMSKVKNGDVS